MNKRLVIPLLLLLVLLLPLLSLAEAPLLRAGGSFALGIDTQ